MKRFLVILCFLVGFPHSAFPEPTGFRTLNTPRFILHIEQGSKSNNQHQQVSAEQISLIAIKLLDETYEEISRILKTKPEEKIVLRFLSPEEFRKTTGAPSWTNAMFLKGEITMPIDESKAINIKDFKEALRHEFTHAVLAEVSGYRIPAWLDEGIAQIIEGEINPVLSPSLRSLVKKRNPIALEKLQQGFTSLENNIVPAAYAQSLFAAKTLINRYGFGKITDYLKNLQSGQTDALAFQNSFGITKTAFEHQIHSQIRRWANSTKVEI